MLQINKKPIITMEFYNKRTNHGTSYNCINCSRSFFAQVRNNIITGRIPHILPCSHLMCDECLKCMGKIKVITCKVCKTNIELEQGVNMTEKFPIDSYVLGNTLKQSISERLVAKDPSEQRQFDSDNRRPSKNRLFSALQPAGMQPFNSRQPRNFSKILSLPDQNIQSPTKMKPSSSRSSDVLSVQSESTMNPLLCTEQPNCHSIAQWQCLDCNEVYCDVCNTSVHNSGKVMRNHVRIPIGSLTAENFEFHCQVHKKSKPDYFCVVCDEFVCCKCMMENHKEHAVLTLDEKNSMDIPDMTKNIEEAEKLLKRLQCEQQKVQQNITSTKGQNKSNSVELEIYKHFSKLHTRLQIIQGEILKEYHEKQNSSTSGLQRLHEELEKRKNDVKSLISMSNHLLNSPSHMKRIQINEINNMYKNLLEAPCFLTGEKNNADTLKFEVLVDTPLKNLEYHCKITVTESANKYKLVPLESLPEGTNLLPNDDEFPPEEKSRSVSRASSISSSSEINACFKSDPNESRKRLPGANPLYKTPSISPSSAPIKREPVFVDAKLELHKGSVENVTVTHFLNPSKFYVQLVKNSRAIENLNNNVAQYVKFAVEPDEIEINRHYLGEYTQKNDKFKCWYRALVKNKIDDNSYEVLYIDYGNTQVLPKSKLREIPDIFMKEPPYLYECKLHSLVPLHGEWKLDCIDVILDFIANKYVQMTVMDVINDVLSVDLLNKDVASLRYTLSFMKVGRSTEEIVLPQQYACRPKTYQNKIYLSSESFKPDQKCDVKVTWVVNPQHFYVQLLENKKQINSLHQKMKNYYCKDKKKDYIYVPIVGTVCAAYFKETWYRAEIIALPGDGNVEIMLLDIGETGIVCWKNIRRLFAEFFTIDAQAIRTSLIDIAPLSSDWSTEACNYFKKHVMGKKLKLLVSESKITELNVILFEEKEHVDVCINALLVNENYAQSTGENSALVEFHKNTDIDETSNLEIYDTCSTRRPYEDYVNPTNLKEDKLRKIITESQQEVSNVAKVPKYKKMVNIVNIESPDCFYVMLPEWTKTRDELTRDLKEHYSSMDVEDIDWQVGEKCAGLSMEFNTWYRGIITNVQEERVSVFFKDIANHEIIPISQVHRLDEIFLQVRDLAFRCCLADIVPAGGTVWTQTAIQEFKDLVQDYKELYITKQGEIVNKSLPVFLYAAWEEVESPWEPSIRKHILINKKLNEKGVALPAKGVSFEEKPGFNIENDPFENKSEKSENTSSTSKSKLDIKDWLPPSPITERKFKARVTYVDHDGFVYLHSEKLENNLKQIKLALNKNFLASYPEPLVEWTPGQMCTVQYHLDKCYYRANIIKVNSPQEIEVRFVDYGNEEICTHNEIRSKVMLITEPVIATKCRLYNVEPKTSDGKWPVPLLDKLHCSIVDKIVEVEVVKKPVKSEPTDVVLILDGKINVNLEVLSANWEKEETEEVKGSILEEDDEDVLIEGSYNCDTASETSDKLTDWVALANLEDRREKIKFTYVNIPASNNFKGLVINVLDYKTIIIEGDFNIDLMKETDKEFLKLSQELNEEGPNQPQIFEPQIGEACCTEYEEDKIWYRAEIYSTDLLNETNEIQVLFVDFGNIESVPITKVKRIKKEWAAYPVQQLKCKLFGIEKSEAIDCYAATSYMSQLILDNKYLVSVRQKVPTLGISLIDLETSQLAYKKAIDENIFVETV